METKKYLKKEELSVYTKKVAEKHLPLFNEKLGKLENAVSASKLKDKRSITVGNTTKEFDGTSDIEFSLDEIGSAKDFEIVQITGDSEENVMSQKIVTDELDKRFNKTGETVLELNNFEVTINEGNDIISDGWIPSLTDIKFISCSRDEDDAYPVLDGTFETTEDVNDLSYYLKNLKSPRIIAMKGANGKHLNPFKELEIYPFSEIGRCLCDINTCEIKYWLHEEDSNKLKDGRTLVEAGIDVMDYDTMVYIPVFYYKREWINNDVIDNIRIDKPLESIWQEEYGNGWKIMDCFRTPDNKIRDYILVAAYEGYVINNQLRSVPGYKPTVNQTIGWFRNIARQGRDIRFNIHIMDTIACLQMLYKIAFKHLDAQLVLGRGVSDSTNTASVITGGTTSMGNRSGYIGVNGKSSVNMFGIENFYGNIWEFVDGFIIKDDGFYKQFDPNKFGSTNYDYEFKTTPLTSEVWRWASMKSIVNFSNSGLDYFNIAGDSNNGATTSTYYCNGESCHIKGMVNIALFGAYWAHSAWVGAFGLDLSYVVSPAYSNHGARLVFLPSE